MATTAISTEAMPSDHRMSSRLDVVEVIAQMRQKEQSVYLRKDYLECPSVDGSKYGQILDGTWRQRIVEWMFGVVDHCSLRRDSVAVAAYYLDLTVQGGVVKSRQDFQLAAMTALQLAIKLYDSTVVKIDSIIKLGRGMFCEQDVINMEFTILYALKWYVHPPTPICFLRQYLLLLPSSIASVPRYMITEVTRFISEISVCLYKFITYPSSAVAYAGILIALERIDDFQLPSEQRVDIYRIFSESVKLDHDSELVKKIVTDLNESLEKNVSLQELMATIQQQCNGPFSSTKQCLQSNPNFEPTSVGSTALCSPRDVIGMCQT